MKCIGDLSRSEHVQQHVRIIVNGRMFCRFHALLSFLRHLMNASTGRSNGGLANPIEPLDVIKISHVEGLIDLFVVENVAKQYYLHKVDLFVDWVVVIGVRSAGVVAVVVIAFNVVVVTVVPVGMDRLFDSLE